MATYYVAEGGTAANKAAATSGTYPGGCMSSAVFNGEDFSAGDTVIISDAGGGFRATLEPPSSGESGNVITYQFSGSVVINGADLFDSGWSVYSGNIYQVSATTEVKNLFYDETHGTKAANKDAPSSEGEWFWDSNVLYLYAASDPGALYTSPGVEGSVRSRCIECDESYYTLDGNGCECKYTTSTAINLRGGEVEWGGTRTTGMIVQDFVVHDIMHDIGSSSGFRAANVENTIIRRIESYRSGWNGIQVTVYANDEENPFTNILVEQCISWGHNHNGFDIHQDPSDRTLMYDVTVQHCVAHSNDQNGFYYMNENCGDTSIYNANCLYNISYNNGRNGIAFDATGTGYHFDNCLIYGNTSSGNGTDITGAGIWAECTDSEIKNNICSENNQEDYIEAEIVTDDDGGTANVIDYNLVYNTAGHVDLYRHNGTDYTHAEYQSFGQQAHGINSDPLFTDADNNNYTLSSGSPCIGAGVNLGSAYDDALHPSSTWPDGVTTVDQDDY